MSRGVLAGVRVLEFDAIGPAPFCGMMLADHGASVIRIGRPEGQPNGVDAGTDDVLLRGRPTVAVHLKAAAGREVALELAGAADILIEGYRPGVMERLGLGPDVCLTRNPRLVYGRVTGYGQDGPLALNPGHDINYIALTGALAAIGDPERPPPPPLSLIGDFGGGGMLLAFGVLAAYLSAKQTGQGQVVDAAMVDGASLLMALVYGWRNAGQWSTQRQSNLLDGGAPFYRTYQTADGKYLAAGAIEPRFYAAFRAALGLHDPLFDVQMDRTQWPVMCDRIAALIASRPLSGWQGAIEQPDACLSPVLTMDEVLEHPHMRARQTHMSGDRMQPTPAPRFHGKPTDAPAAQRYARPPTLEEALDCWPVSAAAHEALTAAAR